MKLALKSVLLAATLAFSGQAQAAVHILNLTGTVASAEYNMFDIPNVGSFRTGNIRLSTFGPITLEVGDTIDATITLDAGWTVPASGEQLFGVNFFQGQDGSPPFDGSVMNEGTTTFFYSLGPTGRLNGDAAPGGCSNCLSNITGQIPGPAFIFDSIRLFETITALDAPFDIDNATISYQLREPLGAVPEPASWALMIAGFGLVGGALRRGSRPTALA